MARRVFSFLLFLMLLFAVHPALAETKEAGMPTFFLMVDRYEGMDYPVGTAVLFGDQATLFTSIWSVQYYGEVIAIGPDGEHAVTGAMPLAEDSEAALLDIEPACTSGEPAQLYYADDDLRMACAVGYDANGNLCTVELGDAVPVSYGGSEAALIASDVPLLTGAIILDDYHRISGVLLATWNDLPNHYVVLPHSTIVSELLGSEIITENTGETSRNSLWRPDPPTLAYEDGCLQVDWSGLNGQKEEIAAYTVYFADSYNYHYSCFEFTDGSTSASIPVVPGRSYIVWVDITTVSGKKPLINPEQYYAVYDVPAAPALTDYGFRQVSAWLASADAEEEIVPNASVLPAMENITAEALSDPNRQFFLQITNSYQVTENIETNMVIALTTPDNLVFSIVSGYIYMPELNEKDAWNADVTSLFQDCLDFSNRQGFAPGRYSLDYYIGGKYAGGIAFMLE